MFDGLLANLPFLMDWSVDGFLKGLNKSLFAWGAIIVVIIGVIMVIVGVFNIAKGLMSGGRSQTNWVLNIALFFLGGALAFGGGWKLVGDVSKGGAKTLEDLGKAGEGGTQAFMIDQEVVDSYAIDLGDAFAIY